MIEPMFNIIWEDEKKKKSLDEVNMAPNIPHKHTDIKKGNKILDRLIVKFVISRFFINPGAIVFITCGINISNTIDNIIKTINKIDKI